MHKKRWIVVFYILNSLSVNGQDQNATDTVDAIIFLRDLFNKEQKEKSSRFAILPSIGYNPTFGFTVGMNGTGVFSSAKSPGSPLSSVLGNFFYSTKKAVNLQIRQNIFLSGSDYYSIGDFQIASLVNPTYEENNNEPFTVRFKTLRLNQRLYRKVYGHFYAGAGLAFEFSRKIKDVKQDDSSPPSTPHFNYSVNNSINPTLYNSNGWMVNILYHTREHPLRSYAGIFAEMVLRVNQTWMGSTKNATILSTDIRKYLSLSHNKPEHVLAFWHWSAFQLSGVIPYLSLPGTGFDLYNRSGRAYTLGRYRGPSHFYLETEYRFPLTANKLFSGVAFVNMQSTSDLNNNNILKVFEPAAGAGLRILINKRTRSNLCLDFAIGSNGSSGFFFGLNEAF